MTAAIKYCKITETDTQWVEAFKAFMAEAEGAMPTDDPTVLVVPVSCDLDKYHGVETHAEMPGPPKSFAEEFPEVVAWLEAYDGTFAFYLSLKQQYQTKGKLSDKQIDAVLRAIERDAERKERRATQQANQDYSIKPGQIIQVTKWAARKLAKNAGYALPHYAFEVVKVEAETPKAIRLTVKMTAQRTAFCCVCGLSLTNPESVTAGIGPICAERSGVSFSETALTELAEKLMMTTPVTDWLPKGAIKTVDGKPYAISG